MKLVIATPLYPPDIGGPATYSKLLEEELPKKGIEVTLVKFGEVKYLPRLIRHFIYYRRILAVAKDASVILALDPVSVGLPVMQAAKKLHKPYVVKIVGDYAWEQGRQRFGITENLDSFVRRRNVPLAIRLLRAVQRRVAQRAATIIVPSEYLKGIVTSWGIPNDKIQVIYNAVPVENPGKVPEAVQGLPRPIIVTAGRLVPWKHISELIDAVSRVHDASFVVLGDGPLRESLEHDAALKLPNRSVFTGLISHADAIATIKHADVFTLNSSYEGLSHLLIEAISLGIPVVATAVGGNTEVIEEGVNGLLVPFGNQTQLETALRSIVSNKDLHARLSNGAHASAGRFSIETMVDRTKELLLHL